MASSCISVWTKQDRNCELICCDEQEAAWERSFFSTCAWGGRAEPQLRLPVAEQVFLLPAGFLFPATFSVTLDSVTCPWMSWMALLTGGGGGQAVAAIFVWVSLFYPLPAWTLLSSSATIRSNHLPVSFRLKTDALCEQMSASRFTSSSSYCPALRCCFFSPFFLYLTFLILLYFLFHYFVTKKKCVC